MGIEQDREELIELALSALSVSIDERVGKAIKPLLRLTAKLCASSDDTAKRLMEAGCELYHVVHLKQARILECMIARGSQLQAMDEHKNSALHLAVKFADLQSVQLLLDSGADSAARNRIGEMPLSLLDFSKTEYSRDKLSILDLLLERITGQICPLELEHLLENGSAEAVARLIRCKAVDFRATDKINQNALHYVAANFQRGVAIQLRLYPYGYDLNASSAPYFQSPLQYAYEFRNLAMTEFFLEQDADIHFEIRVPADDHLKAGLPPTFLYLIASAKPDRYRHHPATFFAESIAFMELFLQHNDDPQLTFKHRDFKEPRTIFDVGPKVLMKPVIAHLAMLQKSGGTIKDIVYSKICLHSPFKRYFQRCQAFVDLEICDSWTLLNLLTDNDKKLSVYLRNEELVQKLIRLSYKPQLRKFFSYYCSSLRRRITRLLRRKRLEEKAASIICDLFGKRIPETHLVTEKIVHFLDTNTLQLMSYL